MAQARLCGSLLLCLSLPALAQFPTAQFAQDEVVVLESAGSVQLTVTISGPGHGGLGVFTQNETALAGFDYTSYSNFLQWSGGDTSSKIVTVPILLDAIAEGEESFLLRLGIGDGVDAGTPSTARVRIVESTGAPQAFFVLPDGIPLRNDGSATFAAEGGTELLLTMQLATFPQSPVAVQYVIEPGGTPQQVLFIDTQSVQLPVPSPQAVPGELFVPRRVRILGSSSKFDAAWFEAWYVFLEEFFGDPCSYCVVNLVLDKFGIGSCDPVCAIVYGSECELPAAKGGTPTTILRRYRDEILTTTLGGQHFIELYAAVSDAVLPALLRDPVLPFDIWRAQDAWIDGIAALIDGSGASYTVTPQMESDLIDLTQRLIALGGPGTADVAEALAELTQQPLSGMTMQQFQSKVEIVGGGVKTQATSWGALKSHY